MSPSERNGGPFIGMRGVDVPFSRRMSSLPAGSPDVTTGPFALPDCTPARLSRRNPAAGDAPPWHITHRAPRIGARSAYVPPAFCASDGPGDSHATQHTEI